MFNGVVMPLIGTRSSQHHLFDNVLSSSPPHNHHDHHHLVMTNQSSSFYDYDPFNQTSTAPSLLVQGSCSNNFSSNDGLMIINNTSLALQRERSTTTTITNNNNYYEDHHQWSSDEVAALHKVRSSLKNWFPDFTWEHVSRKLAELGYRRSADLLKQKYEEEEEEENKQLNKVYPSEQLQSGISTNLVQVNQNEQLLQQHKNDSFMEEIPNREQLSEEVVKESSNKTRKRPLREEEEDTVETLKRCCEEVVNKMMAHQEQLYEKLIDDIIKRDEENIARDEAWKNQEMAKIREEIEMRAQEQAQGEKRQVMIIEFLNKFTSYGDQDKVEEENPISLPNTDQGNDTMATKTTSEDPRISCLEKSSESETTIIEKAITNQEKGLGDNGKKRWPRDEVLALINLRCKMSGNNNSNDDNGDKVFGGKGHLWERISRGMLEMGYKRSAKKCKEKWENINKYFRRTRDSNKKRSMDSRTCPYFHQLSSLYSEGTVLLASPIKH